MPLEEKLKYHNLEDLHNGEYNGYRPAGLRQYVLLAYFRVPNGNLADPTD